MFKKQIVFFLLLSILLIETATASASAMHDSSFWSLFLKGSGRIEAREDYTKEEALQIITSFEERGGTFIATFDDTKYPFQLELPEDATIFPICKGGINRSQTLYRVLVDNTSLHVENPHGIHLGFETDTVRLLPEELYVTGCVSKYHTIPDSLFFDAFGAYRQPRFGMQFNLDPSQQIDCSQIMTTDESKALFQKHYWQKRGPSPRVYITFQSAGFAPLLRADPENAIVIVLLMHDDVHGLKKKNIHAPISDFIDAYHSMYERLYNIFIHGPFWQG